MKRFAVVNEDRCVSCGACTASSSSAWVAQYAFGFRNVYLYAAWLGGNGAVQAKNLVHLLPDGYYDTDDLQNEKIAC